MTASVAAPWSTPLPEGVRLERIRAGRSDETLFLVPGLECDPNELTALVAAFVGPQEVYAVTPAREPATMDRMAEQMVAAIRQHQPPGRPYRLGGYSFGGLLALEMAQQLQAAGEVVAALFLVDAFYDERYWPRGTWLRALVRRTGRQLLRIVRMPPRKAAAELRLRGGRLVQRLKRRKEDAPDQLQAGKPDVTPMAAFAYRAISGYRPRFYDGRLTLVASSVDRHFGCDPVQLWVGYANRLEVQRIDGDHLTVMHEPSSAAAVAGAIDHRLAVLRDGWAGIRPVPGFERPMILTTMRWFSAARLAHALTEAGFAVSACRPAGHPLRLVEGLSSQRRLARLGQLRSVARAIRETEPDIILPDDERALALLRRLHTRLRGTDRAMAALVARSLGTLDSWPVMTSRTALARQAQALNLPAPATAVVGSADALNDWAAGRPFPVVLKTDGSWGGRGVAIVREAGQLQEAWRAISNPPRLARAVKRMLVNREAALMVAWARRVRPVVNAQEYVAGREAIVTAACLEGRVLALVCLEVVQASEAKGPAAAVRVIDHPGMADAARRLVGRLGLSGFCGFDFMLTESGEARVIELNPRVTPTSYLLVDGDFRRSRTIALFPPEPVVIEAAVLDTPVRAPALVAYGEWLNARERRPVARAARRLKERLVPSRY